jgi:hypothetical protein
MSHAALEAPHAPTVPMRPDVEPGRHESPKPVRGRARTLLARPVVACLLLFAAYGALAMLNEPAGTLLADSGGKLATMHTMDGSGSLDPGVGYWAAAQDPSGALHALRFTAKVGDEWVQATTLPMLVASYPLYELGGDRAILVLPMLGGVLCALAARALARRFGASTGWTAFWVVGLLTPVSLYAVSFWEHTLGLAAMLWAIVCFVDVARGHAGWRGAVGGGALFGAAAVFRTEALVYFAVTLLVVLGVLVFRHRAWTRALTVGAVAVGSAAAVLVANVLLEILTVGTSMRAGRTAGAAGAAGAATLSDRIDQATTTATGLNGFSTTIDWVVGAVIVLLLGGGAWALARARPSHLVGWAGIGGACALYAVRFSSGLEYVPGFLTASPFAAVGIVLLWGRRDLWLPAAIACLTLPVVWVTAYSDTMRPQWGGRYALASGALLAVVAVVILAGRKVALAAVVAVSMLVTGYGVVFLRERSQSIATGMEAIVARHDSAVISLEAHLLREGGAFYTPERHWLTATDQGQLREAVRIVRDAGDRELALLVPDHLRVPATIDGFTRTATETIVVRPDQPLKVVTYRWA